MLRIYLLMASLLVLSTIRIAAQEQTVGQEKAVLGQGNVACGTWLQGRSENEMAARTAWILGYITAFNRYESKPEGDVSGGRGTAEITTWIDDHCALHPADNLYDASAALVDELRQRIGR